MTSHLFFFYDWILTFSFIQIIIIFLVFCPAGTFIIDSIRDYYFHFGKDKKLLFENAELIGQLAVEI